MKNKEIKFFFWNMDGKNEDNDKAVKLKIISAYMTSLIEEEKPEILGFAECLIDPNDMLKALGEGYVLVDHYPRDKGSGHPIKNTKYLSVYTNNKGFTLTPAGFPRTKHMQLSILYVSNKKILIGCVHLAAKFKRDLEELYSRSKDYKIEFEDKEFREKIDFDGSIVFGDFNSNPFEKAMTKYDAWHAINIDHIHDKLDGVNYFINPTASLVGSFIYGQETNKPPGTFFYEPDKHKENDLHWNMLDGCIYRPVLHSLFNKKEYKIITEMGGVKLYQNHSITKGYSKHLPITFNFNLI